MSLSEWFDRFSRHPRWSFFGVLIAVGLGALAVYSFFLERTPRVSMDITSEANVLDVHRPLDDLTISFQGEDIEQNNLNLRIFTLRVENDGGVDVLQGHYDQNQSWGLQVPNGRVIEVRLIGSNSQYLQSNVSPRILSDSVIQLNKVIFDRGKYFTLEILVLHNRDELPNIVPLGKIAGIDEITVVRSWLIEGEESFLEEFVYGNILFQIIATVSVTIGLIFVGGILVAMVGAGIGGVVAKGSQRVRRKKVQVLLTNTTSEQTHRKELIEKFISEGPEAISRLKALVEDQEELKLEMKKSELMKELFELGNGPVLTAQMHGSVPIADSRGFGFYPSRVRELVHKGILTGHEDRIVVDAEFQQTLEDLVGLLEPKKS